MPYWWVNHKQTSKIERDGGYIWSPERNNNGARNETYLNLTRVKPLDIVFSYAFGEIGAVGIVEDTFIPSSRPDSFGSIGEQWSSSGWMVPISWIPLSVPLLPRQYLNDIGPLLPETHSPIQKNGHGNQGVYLASISTALGNLILALIENANPTTNSLVADLQKTVEEEIVEFVIGNKPISKTYKDQIIKARVGQGLFRMEVEKIEKACRWTGVADKGFLIASHIKPWKDSNNHERLDGHNGLLLSPHVDKLFDRGFISFEEDGKILVSSGDLFQLLDFWKLDPAKKVGGFSDKQQEYLHYHRERIFNQKY